VVLRLKETPGKWGDCVDVLFGELSGGLDVYENDLRTKGRSDGGSSKIGFTS